ncbi:MAG: hypothetical protein Q8S26_01305 [Azonexus sp.]|nr:hypothetical protein [Azonexus sp.]
MNFRAIKIGCVVLLGSALQVGAAVDDMKCGSLKNAYGPYDYYKDKSNLPVVEGHHFTPEVESLVSGKVGRAGSNVGSDLDYTLRAFPNHPRALMSMVRYGERERAEKPRHTLYTVECYLYRAWRFRPDDGMVRLIYATYLAKHGRSSEALNHLNDAINLGESSSNLDYNIGLIYLDLKDYDKSLSYAHKAYQAGFPLPGLRDRLKKAGKWKEPALVVDPAPQSIPETQEVKAEPDPTK